MSIQSVVQSIIGSASEGRPARVAEMMGALQLTRKECLAALGLAREHLFELGYQLLPGSAARVNAQEEPITPDKLTSDYTHRLTSFAKCDFVYLTKRMGEPSAAVLRVNRYVSEIAYLAMVLWLNGQDIEYEKGVAALAEIGRTEEVLKYGLAQRYLKRYRRQDIFWLRLGWKFFFEYPGFSAEGYLGSLAVKQGE